MNNVLAWTLATILTLPVLFFYLVYIVTVKLNKNKKKAFRLAVDASTIVFIASVHFLIIEVWGKSLLWLIFVLILIVAIVFTIINWKITEEIQPRRLIRGVWRFNFMLFFVIYFFLAFYGLVLRIYHYTY